MLGDCVLNHRCASHQDSAGVWNQFGGRLDWCSRAIVGDDRNFNGRGQPLIQHLGYIMSHFYIVAALQRSSCMLILTRSTPCTV